MYSYPILLNSIRYLQILETLFSDIIQDMNREDFKVGDKYKNKYEELGKP
jgi:hypothetical protein